MEKREKIKLKMNKDKDKNKGKNKDKKSLQVKKWKEKIVIFSKNISYDTKNIIKDNKLLFVYIFGAVLNGIILRGFTIGNVFNLRPVLADMIVTLIFSSLYFVIKKRYRFLYLFIISIVSTLVCLSNIVYYFYYNSFISITFFSFVLANNETGDSNVVGDLLQVKFFILLWLPIALVIFRKKLSKNESIFKKVHRKDVLKTIYIWVLLLFIPFLLSLKPVDFSRLYSQWNREYLVSRFGVYMYQINDVIKSIEPKMATLFGQDKAYKKIDDFYDSKEKSKKNEYTNLLKGKNVIAIHSESMQAVLIGMKINGKEVTPNLNKLVSSGIYFNNFYSEVSFGTSSDTEFTLATSLLPVSSGTVFINYADREYNSLYKSLKSEGYYTFSMHANTGDFWNRNIMHKNLGYDKFYDKKSYDIDEEIGFGLSDRSFIRQSVSYIKEIDKEHKKYYGTLITLSNHTPFDYNELFDKFDVSLKKNGKSYPYLEGTKLGNYIVSAHYADKQIGYLIDSLEDNDLLDDTVIVLYGDHDARISTSNWNRYYNYDYKTNSILDENSSNYKNLDYYWQELNRKVPLIIWSNDSGFKEYSTTIDTAMGMYDLAPTLSNMLGVSNKYYLGSDIMNMSDNVVPFPNGNFVTNYVYYNGNKNEYKLLTNKKVSKEYIRKNKEYTEEIIDISNDIIVYNYFGRDKESEERVE